ncbi:MAG TPA: CBS domain-containing protein [Burkholderiales bacterium]|nr:CBS domain-containing protein [Burkholderiales bacterium]
MLIKEILKIKGNALYTISPEGRLADAVTCMVDYDIGSLVVMDHGKLAGMLTFREVLGSLADGRGSVDGRLVKDVMVSEPATVSPDMEVDELRRIMIESHARYMPVMEDDTLIGVLSFHDVARAVLEDKTFENRMLKDYIERT